MNKKNEYLKEISYKEILKINRESRFKADKIVEYYTERDNLIHVLDKTLPEGKFLVNSLTASDLKYKSIHFEPPIGRREWIAWGLLLVSIVVNLCTAIYS